MLQLKALNARLDALKPSPVAMRDHPKMQLFQRMRHAEQCVFFRFIERSRAGDPIPPAMHDYLSAAMEDAQKRLDAGMSVDECRRLPDRDRDLIRLYNLYEFSPSLFFRQIEREPDGVARVCWIFGIDSSGASSSSLPPEPERPAVRVV